jgi:DNA-binding beta-propeller fold protein YncE
MLRRIEQIMNSVSTIAGSTSTTTAGANDGAHHDERGTTDQSNEVAFKYPCGVAVDGDGNNIFVADFSSHRIYMVTPQGQVSTLAGGTGSNPQEGCHRDGEGTIARFNHPMGVAVDGDGNIIVADTNNHRIRRITPRGHVSTLAGTGCKGYGDGEGTVAHFNNPTGVAVDEDGNVIVADMNNHCIRKITPQGQVSTLAGTGKVKGIQDGDAAVGALFNHPVGVAVDGDAVIVADADNNRICKITQQPQVSSTPIGTTGNNGSQCNIALVHAVCNFNDFRYRPAGVAADGNGNIIVTFAERHVIRKITSTGGGQNPFIMAVTTLAGISVDGRHRVGDIEMGHRDGNRASALFNEPSGVAVDGNGDIIVADSFNRCIRRVTCDELTTPRVFLNNNLPQQSSTFAYDILHNFFDSGSFYDVCFVVEQERVPAHRGLLSARCEYFKSMFRVGFKEGDSNEIHIKGTTSAAFKALLKYLYTDSIEVDDAVVCDLAKLCDQYRVERLHNHCLLCQNATGSSLHTAGSE